MLFQQCNFHLSPLSPSLSVLFSDPNKVAVLRAQLALEELEDVVKRFIFPEQKLRRFLWALYDTFSVYSLDSEESIFYMLWLYSVLVLS